MIVFQEKWNCLGASCALYEELEEVVKRVREKGESEENKYTQVYGREW